MHTGILGGSFNPIHVGHLRLAAEMLERLQLARVDLVPCSIPPHKDTTGLLPFALRAEGVCLALNRENLRSNAKLCCNTLEKERQGPSYTIDTLKTYAQREPEASLYFILGAGDLLTLPSWKQGLELVRHASLVVVPREETDLKAVAQFIQTHWEDARRVEAHSPEIQAEWSFAPGTSLVYLPLPRMDISSTMVRSSWREGRRLLGLVPETVVELLESRRELVDKVWGEETRAKRRDSQQR